MFHYKNGFFAKRNKNGSVHLEQRKEAKDISPVIFSIDIDVDGWASIISTVSKKGETSETFEKAQKFHNNS